MAELKISGDASPLNAYLKLLESLPDVRDAVLGGVEHFDELVRVDSYCPAAGASEVRVVLYPSDFFLGRVATVFAGQIDGDVI